MYLKIIVKNENSLWIYKRQKYFFFEAKVKVETRIHIA